MEQISIRQINVNSIGADTVVSPDVFFISLK